MKKIAISLFVLFVVFFAGIGIVAPEEAYSAACPAGKECLELTRPGTLSLPLSPTGESGGYAARCTSSNQLCKEAGYDGVICSSSYWAKNSWSSPSDNYQKDYDISKGGWFTYGASSGDKDYWTLATCERLLPPPSGTISVAGCSIPAGGSTCNASVSWSTSNLISGAYTEVTHNNPDNTSVSTSTSGSNVSSSVNYGPTTFYLYHNGSELDSAGITTDCVSGTTWNESSCEAPVTPTTYTVTPTAGPGGIISPNVPLTVIEGSIITYSVTPYPGFVTYSIDGCNGYGSALNTYTTGEIRANCTVSASFSAIGDPALGISTPASSTITLPTTAFSASYTLSNGTGADTDCYLYNYDQSEPELLKTDTTCSSPMTYNTPAAAGSYGYYMKAYKASTNETKWSSKFTVTVNAAAAGTPTAPNVSTLGWTVDNSSTWPILSTPSALTGNQSMRAKLVSNGGQYYNVAYGVNSGKITSSPSAGLGQTMSFYIWDYGTGAMVGSERLVAVNICGSGTSWNGSSCSSTSVNAVPVTYISANPLSMTAPANSTSVYWDSTNNATSCFGWSNPYNTSWNGVKPRTSLGQTVTGLTVGSNTFYMNCTNSFGSSGTASVTVSVASAALSDLVAGSPTPTTARAGLGQTYTSTITNYGAGSVSGNIKHIFIYRDHNPDYDPDYEPDCDTEGGSCRDNDEYINIFSESMSSGTIAASGGTVVIANTYTFSVPGRYSVQVCADQNEYLTGGTVNEGTPLSYGELNNCSDWVNIDVVAALPNLTASAPTPSTATVNVARTYTATISNTGNASTGSFSNFWQTATAINGGGTVTDLASSSMPALGAGGSATSTSPSITFASGTPSVRVCADKSSSGSSGIISESNEGDNCSPWTNVTVAAVTPVPVVSISASPTSGTVNVVNPSLTWSATNSPTSCTASGDWSGAKSVSGTNVSQGVLTTVKTYTYTLTCSNATGTSAPASATVVVTASVVVVNGQCATPPHGSSFSEAPSGPLCSSGTPSPSSLTGSGPWTWVCEGTGSGHTDAACSASFRKRPIFIED